MHGSCAAGNVTLRRRNAVPHKHINCWPADHLTVLVAQLPAGVPSMASATLDFVAAHAPGMAGIDYARISGTLKIVSCGQDGQLCVQDAADLSDKITKSLQADQVACHCLAVSPEQDSFAVGDQGHFVKACVYAVDCKQSTFWTALTVTNNSRPCSRRSAAVLIQLQDITRPVRADLQAP